MNVSFFGQSKEHPTTETLVLYFMRKCKQTDAHGDEEIMPEILQSGEAASVGTHMENSPTEVLTRG